MRLTASFTVEAALVLSVVFLTLGAVIKNAYRLCDDVTGGMILEESLEKMRCGRKEGRTAQEYAVEGEEEGNPRLLGGVYQIRLERDGARAKGKALSGDRERRIEMDAFEPGMRIRRWTALSELGESLNDHGS